MDGSPRTGHRADHEDLANLASATAARSSAHPVPGRPRLVVMAERKLLLTRKLAAEEAGVSEYEMKKLCAMGAIYDVSCAR